MLIRGPVGDVVVDRLGEAVPALEHHPHPPPQRGRIERRVVDVARRRAGSRPCAGSPGSRSCMRLIERRKVDFPQPDGPISAVIERGGMSTVMSKSACFSPYQNENSRAASVPRCTRARGRRRCRPTADGADRRSRSSEPTRDVGFGARVLGRREQRRSSAPPRPARRAA